MDKFRQNQQHECQVGGIHCDCCNSYKGKDKKKLNRLARHKLKQQDQYSNMDEIEERIKSELGVKHVTLG